MQRLEKDLIAVVDIPSHQHPRATARLDILQRKSQQRGLQQRTSQQRGLQQRTSQQRGMQQRGMQQRGLQQRGLQQRGLQQRGLQQRKLQRRSQWCLTHCGNIEGARCEGHGTREGCTYLMPCSDRSVVRKWAAMTPQNWQSMSGIFSKSVWLPFCTCKPTNTHKTVLIFFLNLDSRRVLHPAPGT